MTNEMTNELAVVNQDMASVSLLDDFKDPKSKFFCSIVDDGTRDSKIAIYNAINSADENVADHIGEILEIKHIVAHPVQLVDEKTGEVVHALRCVLIDKNDKAYQAVSGGIANSLTRIMGIMGDPSDGSWEKNPVKMKIKQVKTRNGMNKVNTVELVK